MSQKLQIEGQTDQRCPHCAALVRADAAWCTLCYADLRAAASEPVARSGSAPQSEPVALSGPAQQCEPAPIPRDGCGPAVVGWPCQRCGGLVALTEPTCTHCGVGFLEGGDDSDPVVRRLRGGLSNQVKAMIMVGGATLLLLIIFGLGYLVPAVF